MTSTALENLPEIWDDESDVPFFRITAPLFTLAFCLGASVLLASNGDDEDTHSFSPAEASTTPVTVRWPTASVASLCSRAQAHPSSYTEKEPDQ